MAIFFRYLAISTPQVDPNLQASPSSEGRRPPHTRMTICTQTNNQACKHTQRCQRQSFQPKHTSAPTIPNSLKENPFMGQQPMLAHWFFRFTHTTKACLSAFKQFTLSISNKCDCILSISNVCELVQGSAAAVFGSVNFNSMCWTVTSVKRTQIFKNTCSSLHSTRLCTKNYMCMHSYPACTHALRTSTTPLTFEYEMSLPSFDAHKWKRIHIRARVRAHIHIPPDYSADSKTHACLIKTHAYLPVAVTCNAVCLLQRQINILFEDLHIDHIYTYICIWYIYICLYIYIYIYVYTWKILERLRTRYKNVHVHWKLSN